MNAILGIVAVIVALGVVVVVGLVVLGGSDEEDLTARGEPIVNAPDALVDAEREANELIDDALAAGEDVAHDGDVSCWYSYPGGGDEPQEFLRCGPVAFVDSAEGAYWLRIPVTFQQLGDGALAVVEPVEAERRTWTGAEDEELRRSDGTEAPAPDDIDLERPDAPAARPGRTGAVDPAALMMDMEEEPDDDGLRGVGYGLTVDRFTTATDRVRLAGGRGDPGVFAPAEGERWLVFEVSTSGSGNVLRRDPLELGLVVDGERSPLGPVGESGRPHASATFAASVPVDAEEVALTVDDGVARQRWSFGTQERGDDSPTIFYRDPETRTTRIDQERSLPYGVNDQFTPSPFGENDLSLTFGEARLDYAVQVDYLSGESVVHTASSPDRALLYLVDVTAAWDNYLDSPYPLSPFDYVLSPEDAVLTLADGTEVRPTLLPADVYNLGSLVDLDAEEVGVMTPTDIFGGFLVWDVPADLRHATLRIQPGTRVTPTTLIEVDFQGGTMEVEIDFGT